METMIVYNKKSWESVNILEGWHTPEDSHKLNAVLLLIV